MLTLPVEAGRAAADRPARILLIGRSETVLSEAVTILREEGCSPHSLRQERTPHPGRQPKVCLSGRTFGGRSAGTKMPPGQRLH